MTTARSIGDVLAHVTPSKPKHRYRHFSEQQRNSRIYRPLASSKREARKIIAIRLQAAEAYNRNGKQAGQRNGPLGHIGIEVLRALYSVIDYKTGRLDPSIDWICEKIKRARASVVSAMKRLKQHGFLDWIRRFEAVKNDGPGPQVHQITNAYCFGIPAAIAAWVRAKLAPAPIPDDEAERQIAYDQNVSAMLDGEGFEATARYMVAPTTPQGQRLIRIGKSFDLNASSTSSHDPDPDIIMTR